MLLLSSPSNRYYECFWNDESYQKRTAEVHSNPETKDTPFNFESQGYPQRQSNDVICNKVHDGTDVLAPWSTKYPTYDNLCTCVCVLGGGGGLRYMGWTTWLLVVTIHHIVEIFEGSMVLFIFADKRLSAKIRWRNWPSTKFLTIRYTDPCKVGWSKCVHCIWSTLRLVLSSVDDSRKHCQEGCYP